MSDIENTNEYDDMGWAQYSSEAQSAVTAWWEAGCSVDEIGEMLSNAFGDAGVDVAVELSIETAKPDTTVRPAKPKPKNKTVKK